MPSEDDPRCRDAAVAAAAGVQVIAAGAWHAGTDLNFAGHGKVVAAAAYENERNDH